MKIFQQLNKLSDPKRAQSSLRFFKTGKGQYGEGDKFLGIVVPSLRIIAKQNIEADLNELQELINSDLHECRLTALLVLTYKYEKITKDKNLSDEQKTKSKKKIFEFYLKNTKQINNRDLVDLSAPNIVGKFLYENNLPKDILYKLVKSKNLWEKRISILSTFTFIKNQQFADAFKIAELLLNDSHDLMHKAVGRMLREIGKRNQSEEEDFLKKYHKIMPRTMLRYAIEKFSDEKRKFYMSK